jgi:hypothetical protein
MKTKFLSENLKEVPFVRPRRRWEDKITRLERFYCLEYTDIPKVFFTPRHEQ